MLLPEEYVEQAFFFESFIEAINDGIPAQEFLHSIRGELLATALLYKAVDFMRIDIKYTGMLASSMSRLTHYFSPFQIFIIEESEREDGKLDFKTALQILAKEAKYRCDNPSAQGVFLYQFETICRNRLGYIRGLDMLIKDDFYNSDWKKWLIILQRQIGFVPLADMIFYRSEYYKMYDANFRNHQFENVRTNNFKNQKNQNDNNCNDNNCNENAVNNPPQLSELLEADSTDAVILFGEREGRIAFATRNKEPAYLFSALSRHLGYPSVPRKKNVIEEENIVPVLKRKIEQLENRIQLLEEELRGGIDLKKYM
ncbi:MAG: hypothetical protein LBE18_11265 [Planctomycetaceae bacterium]|jgi:hypothetical protein|nr:hypothetical protein [Planctomycetaceae bacterium]